MGNRQRLYTALEARFGIIVWLMVVWLVLAWFAPIIMQDLVDVIYYNRDNYFVDMNHILHFITTNDGLFVFMLIITVAMLVLGTSFTIFYIYGKIKYRNKIAKMDKSIINNPWFRLTMIVIMMVIITLVSVASLMQLVCMDNLVLRDRAVDLKFPVSHIRDARMYARYAVDMAFATQDMVVGNMLPGSAFYEMMNDYVFITKNSTKYQMFTNETILGMAVNNKLKVNGVLSTPAQLMINTSSVYIIDSITNGVYDVMIPGYTRESTYDSQQGLDYNMAINELLSHDLSMDSLAKYIYKKIHTTEPDKMQLVEMMAMPQFKLGLSYGVVSLYINSIAKRLMFTHENSTMHIDEIENFTSYCISGQVYASVIYFISFMMTLLVSLGLFFKKMCKSTVNAEIYDVEPLLSGSDETEAYYDEPATNWSDYTPMSGSG